MKTGLFFTALWLLMSTLGMAQQKDSVLFQWPPDDLLAYQYQIKTKKKPIKVKVLPTELVLQYLVPAARKAELKEVSIPIKGKKKVKLTDETIAKLKRFSEKVNGTAAENELHHYLEPIEGRAFIESFKQSTGPLENYVAPLQNNDPFAPYFYPPELVMQYKSKIGLTEEQETTLRKVVDEATQSFNNFNWELKSATQELLDQIAEPKISLASAQEQLKKIITLEEQVKMLQLQVMITIKNQLTQQQQQQLDTFKK